MQNALSRRFGQKVRAVRKDKRLTQEDVGQRSRTSRATVFRLESGENVGIHDVCAILESLGHTLAIAETIRPTWENAWEAFGMDDDEPSEAKPKRRPRQKA